MRKTKAERTAQSRGCEISVAVSAAMERWGKWTRGYEERLTLARTIEFELGRAGFRIVREPKGRTENRCPACAALSVHAPDCDAARRA